jgi:hypothetical protein
MKKFRIMPALAAALFVAGCDDSGDPTTVDTRAGIRFFNATTGMTGSGGFTSNGQFVTGSALAFGQASSACSRVDQGTTSFGFGASNSGGTALDGNALATLNNQSITASGNYTVAATGSAASPTLFLLDNTFTGTLGSNQAAVRFVNLAPGTGTTATTFTVFLSPLGPGVSPNAIDIAPGVPTTFSTVTSGSNEFTVLAPGHTIVISGSTGALNLQGGSVNTLAIVPNGDGYKLTNIQRCS